jgi:6,7-dimethyl-8-ribityllumazine synthase
LLGACTEELRKHGVSPADMLLVSVSGALEIPLALHKLAQSARYDALIALGAVIRGETYHFEIVSNESAAGITRVQLDNGIPVGNGVLTTDDEDQALARMSTKGAEAARAALEMARLLKAIDERN